MKLLIVVLVLACVAYAQDLTIEMEELPMPQIPDRMKLDDIKYVFKNLPPATKERLYSILNLLGMSIDDVEQALDNPAEEVKQMFGPLGMNLDDMRAALDKLPESLKRIF